MVDGTRKVTLTTALKLKKIADSTLGRIPFVLVVNKLDLKDKWEIDPLLIKDIQENGAIVIETSAKTGEEVKMAFQLLTKKMMDK